MKKRYWAFLIGSWCLSVGMQAAKVDTLSVHSDAMNKEVQVITICPDKAMAGEKCPVLYLLHGYGGNAGTWLGIKPELPRIADKEGIIFVCPDGKNSWYWDSPLNKEYRYETFVSKELVNYIDKNFTTKAERGGYFDSFLKIAALEDKDISAVVEKLERMSDFFQVDFILSVSRDESELPESVKDKIIVSL